jgi:heme-degrading monooxygenase HmoA
MGGSPLEHFAWTFAYHVGDGYGILARQAPNEGGVAMHARVSTYQGASDRLIEGFEKIREPLEQIDGFSHAYFLVDDESGKALSITIWDSEEALLTSVAKADELRKQGADAGGAEIESVQHYEIRMTVGTPTAA